MALLWWDLEYLPVPKTLASKGEGSCGEGLDSPCSVSCIGLSFSHGSVISVCGEHRWVFFFFGGGEVSYGSLLDNNSNRHNPIPVLEASCGDKWCSVGALSTPIFGSLLRLPSYMYTFQEASTALGFHAAPKTDFNFICLSTYPSLIPLFSLPLHLILPFQ